MARRGPVSGAARGALLVELLVAMAVLAFALASVSSIFYQGRVATSRARDLGFAAELAAEQAETLALADLGSLAGGADVAMLGAVAFDRVWTVAANVPQPEMWTLVVRVTSRRAGAKLAGDAVEIRRIRVR